MASASDRSGTKRTFSIRSRSPQATVDVAALAEYVCSKCSRDGTFANPCPKRHKGQHLTFASKSECMPCRKFGNSALKGKSAKSLKEDLKDPKKKDEYLTSLHEHEQLFDNSQGQVRDVGGKIQLPKWISGMEETKSSKKKFLYIWWPQDALDRESIPYDDSQLVPEEGQEGLGLLRDCKHHPVSGCVESSCTDSKMLQRVKLLTNTSVANKDAVSSTWKSLKGSLGKSTVSITKSDDGAESVDVVAKGVASIGVGTIAFETLQLLSEVKCCAFWNMFTESVLPVLRAALTTQQVSATDLQKAIDVARSVPFLLAVSLPSTQGHGNVLSSEDLAREDTRFQTITAFSECLVRVLAEMELQDDTTLAAPNVFGTNWQELMPLAKQLEDSMLVCGVKASVVIVTLALLAEDLSGHLCKFFDSVYADHPWFKKLATATSQPKILWPAQLVDADEQNPGFAAKIGYATTTLCSWLPDDPRTPKYSPLRAFVAFNKLGCVRLTYVEASKSKANDLKSVAKKLDKFEAFVDMFENVQSVVDKLEVPRLSDALVNEKETASAMFKTLYGGALVALSRPVPTGETSKSLAQKAIQTIDALRGSLPCKLGMVLKTAAE